MDDIDPREVSEVVDEPILPEAPESLHIDAYYKGFHFGITKRSRTAKIRPYIDDAINAIDYMIEKDCNPSWNTETNKQNGAKTGQDNDSEWIREPVQEQQPKEKKNWKKCAKHDKWFDAGKYATCFECTKE